MTTVDPAPERTDGVDVDVVIVSWNSGPDLETCLPALPASARAIVVDNASADPSTETAHRLGADVVELTGNTGYAAAVNAGLAVATAPYVLVLNPDVVLTPGCVERCVAALAADPTIGLVGANLREADGTPVPTAARRDLRAVDVFVNVLRLNEVNPWLDRKPVRDRSCDRDVDAVQGSFMLMRTEELRALGGLDPAIFMYFEDIDLCRRVRDGGQRVRFLTGAEAIHAGATSTGRASAEQREELHLNLVDGELEFLRRYRGTTSCRVAIVGYVLKALLGLAAEPVLRRGASSLHRRELRFALSQWRRRRPAPTAALTAADSPG
jgi:N-acetylglucosaminyl-diphospho-decaprenol L-rhamnosyltransferase